MKLSKDVMEVNLSENTRSPALVVIRYLRFKNGKFFIVRRGGTSGAFVWHTVYEIMKCLIDIPREVWERCFIDEGDVLCGCLRHDVGGNGEEERLQERKHIKKRCKQVHKNKNIHNNKTK